MQENQTLIEGIDYTMNEEGLMVLSESYLLKRGYCCKSGCLNCPYGFTNEADPNIPSELINAWGKTGEEEIEIYDGEIDEE